MTEVLDSAVGLMQRLWWWLDVRRRARYLRHWWALHRSAGTLSLDFPLRPGSLLAVDVGELHTELVVVGRSSGDGPYLAPVARRRRWWP